jgi:protein SCO1/2
VTIGKDWCAVILLTIAAGWLAVAGAAGKDTSLPRIGPAPEFTLTNQNGNRLSLEELQGKVVVVTFIFGSCTDACPLLTAKMAMLQSRLGADFGPQVFFVSVTVDPERDTPEVLKRYASAHGAELAGWAFLTGTPAEIRDVTRRYGVAYKKMPSGNVDHTFLTSLVDRRGRLRVQYLGVRFDPDELFKDIRSLLQERD